jgi:diguanylate cyclase (GGDEF)-like protein
MSLRADTRYTIFLYTGFGLLLVASVYLSIYSFQQIIQANRTLNYDTNNNNIQLQAAMTMRGAIRERAILLWQMTLQEDIFERDELYQKFSTYGTQYLQARQDYLSTTFTEQEKSLISLLDHETVRRAPALRQFADLLMQEPDKKPYAKYLDRTISDQVIVSSILDRIISSQHAKNEAAHKKATESTALIFPKLVAWIIIIIVASIIFARFIVNASSNQIKLLNKTKNQLDKLNKELKQLVRRDHLTGLPNRRYFLEHLERSLSLAKRHSQTGALLYIDLDGFKLINDSYGHNTGDVFLKIIALEMDKQLRDSDVLARLGGDEFVVMLSLAQPENVAIRVAESLLKILSEEYTIDGITISASASIGICFFPGDNRNVEKLLGCADDAMYKAKQSGKNTYFIHHPSKPVLLAAIN